jgi:hypothetical protein
VIEFFPKGSKEEDMTSNHENFDKDNQTDGARKIQDHNG